MEFTSDAFKSDVLGNELPVLIHFYTDNVLPCLRMEPVIRELAIENVGNAIVGKMNVMSNIALSRQYGITTVPYFMVFLNGRVGARLTGIKSKAVLQGLIDTHHDAA